MADSSVREKQPPWNAKPMPVATSPDLRPALPDDLLAESLRVAAMADDAIDLSDMPEVADWSGATRGAFFRPIKHQLTLRLDSDIIAWFKSRQGKSRGYQTAINAALRDYITQHTQK